MRDKIKGAVLGALVAACATVLLAQTPPWTAPITWTTGDLLTASQFNAQFRDNLLNLRAFSACAETGITGTASADTVLFGDCRWDGIAYHHGGRAGHGRHVDHGPHLPYQVINTAPGRSVFGSQEVTVYLNGVLPCH